MDASVEINAVAYMPGSAGRSRLHVVQQLTKALPLNQYGLPAFLYRPDLIPEGFDELDTLERDQTLNIATFPLTYAEGFPALTDGTPLWGPLPFEDITSYDMFKGYLDLADSHGVRRVDLLNSYMPSLDREQIIEAHTYYYWALRAKAHDLFQIAAAQKMRERRILKTTDKHFLEAEKLLGHMLNWFGKKDDEGNFEWEKDLTGKAAVDMMEKLVRIQRISIGLSATGQNDANMQNPETQNASTDMLMREIANKSMDSAAEGGVNGLELLLSDPKTAMEVQALILKVNANGKERTISAITDTPTSIADEIG